MTDIQAAEIHSYGQGKAFFHPARDSLHETPHCLAHNWEDECRGWERHGYHTPAPPGIGRNSSFALAELRLQKSVTLAEKSKYHLVKFLGNLTWVAMPPEHARRSSRIAREIAILLVGSDMEGKVFSEQTKTVLLSRHGAGIVSQYVLSAEQELILRRLDTNKETEVRVVGNLGAHGKSYTYGVAFLNPETDLWDIKFPGMTDSEKEASHVVLQCSGCKAKEMVQQSDLESDVYLVNEGIVRTCKSCGSSTFWRRPIDDTGDEPLPLEAAPAEAEE